jgi:DNA-binding CsgD family transcriptional regulator
VEALLERGRVAEAIELLGQTGGAGELPRWLPSLVILARRIGGWVAAGDLDAALADLDAAETMAGAGGSVAIPWRGEGALACLASGDTLRAQSLSEQQLRLARDFGAPGTVGAALRVAGVVAGVRGGLVLLEESVSTLAQTPMQLEHAKALAALGAAQRRAGRRTEARKTLAVALDLADACGAIAVANQAREELLIAGARPRRNRISGPDALTACELRIATLTADGLTNSQIAQAVFVTPKTVERHLTNVYAKLGIAARSELEAALGAPA